VGQLALAVEHFGAAVEDQLVLAAYLVEVDERQAGLIAAFRHQLAADPGFFLIIRRGIDGEQQLGPRRLGGQRRTRLPEIFADEQTQLMATERHHTGIGRRSEVALLVEHPVVGQVLFEITCPQLTALVERRRIVKRPLFAPGMAHQNGTLSLPCRDAGQRSLDPDHQVGSQQQILRRVSCQGQLGANQQIGPLLIGQGCCRQYLVTVIFDGAYRQI